MAMGAAMLCHKSQIKAVDHIFIPKTVLKTPMRRQNLVSQFVNNLKSWCRGFDWCQNTGRRIFYNMLKGNFYPHHMRCSNSDIYSCYGILL